MLKPQFSTCCIALVMLLLPKNPTLFATTCCNLSRGEILALGLRFLKHCACPKGDYWHRALKSPLCSPQWFGRKCLILEKSCLVWLFQNQCLFITVVRNTSSWAVGIWWYLRYIWHRMQENVSHGQQQQDQDVESQHCLCGHVRSP